MGKRGKKDVKQPAVQDCFESYPDSACIFIFRQYNKRGKKIYFKGDETSLEFLSGVSMVPGNKYGIVYVRYQVSSDQNSKKMSFYEKNITHISDSINLHDVKSDDFYELFPEIHEFGFEYLKEYTDADILENQLQWQKTWDPDIDKGFPRAVRIGFQETEQSHPVYIVIPIKKEIIS